MRHSPILHSPALRQADGVEYLPVQIAYVFWPATGECLGTLTYVCPYRWRVSVWGPDGLIDVGTMHSRTKAVEYLKMQRQELKSTQEEDGECHSETT